MSALVAESSSGSRGRGTQDGSRSSVFAACSSSRCGGQDLGDRRKRALARSQTVSDMELKVGGDCTQPMVEDMGMATN